MEPTKSQAVDGAAEEPIVVGQLLAGAVLGGAEILAAHLANCHARAGHPSHVIVLWDEGPLDGRLAPGVALRHCHYLRASIRNPWRFLVSLVRGFRILRRDIRENGIDVLHVHLPDAILWGWVMQLVGACRVTVTIHSNEFFPVGGSLLRRLVSRVVYGRMVEQCRPVVMVSEKVRASFVEKLHLTAKAGARLRVIDNGIPIPGPRDERLRREIRRRYGAGDGDCLVVAAGRLAPEKNFRCLIRAAGRLQREGGGLRFVIGGEGVLRGELEELVREQGLQELVHLPGNLDDLQAIMAAADVFCIPSLWEGLPMVLLEAMASGLPVAGSRVRGIADIIEENRHGLLFAVDDDSELAAVLRRLADDPELRQRLGLAGGEFVRAGYSIERVYAEYSEVYRERMGQYRANPAGRTGS